MPECTNCGAHVTARFARVFGNNEDTVQTCLECAPNSELGTSPEGSTNSSALAEPRRR